MYNTQFKVKYNDIEKELLIKYKQTNKDDTLVEKDDDVEKDDGSVEEGIPVKDILDICNKLYRDELLSVFGLQELDEEKMSASMDEVYDKMIQNIEFKKLMDDLKKLYIKEYLLNETLDTKEDEEEDDTYQDLTKILLTSLFVQPLFYITHKCICQQFETGIIDNDLLVELRKNSIDLINI